MESKPALFPLFAIAFLFTCPIVFAGKSKTATLTRHGGAVFSAAFAPDGKTLASGGNDGEGTVRMWDAKSHKLMWSVKLKRSVSSVRFSDDGRTLAVLSSGALELRDSVTGKLNRRLKARQREAMLSFVFLSGGKRLLTAGNGDPEDCIGFGVMTVWIASTGTAKTRVNLGEYPTSEISFVERSPRGRTIACVTWNTERGGSNLDLRDATTLTVKRTLLRGADVYEVAFSHDGRTLASSHADGTLKLWDIQTCKLKRTLSGHKSGVRPVAFSPDGRTVASGSEDGTVKLWDPQTGKLKQTLSGHKDPVWFVVFSRDGRTLVSGGADETVRFWNINKTKQ